MVQFLEQVVHGIEVRPHVWLLGPALFHDVESLRWGGAFAH
jgi:hypothetical protein